MQVLRIPKEGDLYRSHRCGTHSACVRDIEFGHGGKEDIVEVGGFEGHVDDCVKKVPDEKYSDLSRTRFAEEGEGTTVGCSEDSYDRCEGEDARVVEYGTTFELR